jgi:hypothetical protein
VLEVHIDKGMKSGQHHGTELSKGNSNTLAMTRRTLLDGTLLAAESITALAQDRL